MPMLRNEQLNQELREQKATQLALTINTVRVSCAGVLRAGLLAGYTRYRLVAFSFGATIRPSTYIAVRRCGRVRFPAY